MSLQSAIPRPAWSRRSGSDDTSEFIPAQQLQYRLRRRWWSRRSLGISGFSCQGITVLDHGSAADEGVEFRKRFRQGGSVAVKDFHI